ncbi:uncharacterized protein LOC121375549 isoform X2 [Gigantopelta aegis]|nr:uncharacterized protein LOC121375549 isoform X2 [Gigantopelta aegis]
MSIQMSSQKMLTNKLSSPTTLAATKQNSERSVACRRNNQHQETSSTTTFLTRYNSGNITFPNFFPLNTNRPVKHKRPLRCIQYCMDHEQIDCDVCYHVDYEAVLPNFRKNEYIKQQQSDFCQNNIFHKQIDWCQNNVYRTKTRVNQRPDNRYNGNTPVEQWPESGYIKNIPVDDRSRNEYWAKSQIDQWSKNEYVKMLPADRCQNNVCVENTSADRLQNQVHRENTEPVQTDRIFSSSSSTESLTDRMIREKSGVKKSESFAKEPATNNKAKMSCLSKDRSLLSSVDESTTFGPVGGSSTVGPVGSSSTVGPVGGSSSELPSSSTYVFFYTPDEEQSVEFFTPSYSPKCICPKYASAKRDSPKHIFLKCACPKCVSPKSVSSNHHSPKCACPKCVSPKSVSSKCEFSKCACPKGVSPKRVPSKRDSMKSCTSPKRVNQTTDNVITDNVPSLCDLPPNLADLKIPLLNKKDISYCRKQNGSVVSIGHGVYGGVYLAELKGKTSKVVIKDFESSVTSSENNIIKEANILRHLQPTGFVPELIGVTREDPGRQLALVQEFFGRGVTLGKLLNDTPVLSYR